MLSTSDVLLRLEHTIRKGMDMNFHTLVVYLDLKGAYDKVWHDGLLYRMKKQHDMLSSKDFLELF